MDKAYRTNVLSALLADISVILM